MARINTTQLIHNATKVSFRAYQVQQDPAVQKSWSEAGRDVSKAAKSCTKAALETRAAWRRAGIGAGTNLTRLYA